MSDLELSAFEVRLLTLLADRRSIGEIARQMDLTRTSAAAQVDVLVRRLQIDDHHDAHLRLQAHQRREDQPPAFGAFAGRRKPGR